MKLVKPKSTRSKLGKRSRAKGASYERSIAKLFEKWSGVEFVRTPLSGGFGKNKTSAEDYRGDIVPADRKKATKLHIECKNQKTWSLPAWLKQAQNDTKNNGRIPIVVFHRHGTSDDYVCLRLEDYFLLTEPNKCFTE